MHEMQRRLILGMTLAPPAIFDTKRAGAAKARPSAISS
jgi:hypothetical protein